jgi:hypothetical protein
VARGGAGQGAAVTYGFHPVPDHAPLKPCPFCGREAKVIGYRNAPDQPVRYQVGCWVEDDHSFFSHPWDDCFGPLSSHEADLDEIVRRWNQPSGLTLLAGGVGHAPRTTAARRFLPRVVSSYGLGGQARTGGERRLDGLPRA